MKVELIHNCFAFVERRKANLIKVLFKQLNMKKNLEKHMNDKLRCSMIELLHQLMLDPLKRLYEMFQLCQMFMLWLSSLDNQYWTICSCLCCSKVKNDTCLFVFGMHCWWINMPTPTKWVMKDYCMLLIKIFINMPINLVKVPTKLDHFGGCGNVA